MNLKPTKLSLLIRIVAIVFLSLTAAMTLLGGIGTTCVAFFAENFGPRMAALIPVKPIFQALVFISLVAGIYGVISIVRLAKGRPKAYQQVLRFLVVGLAASAVQFYYSLTLRGSTAPNNMRLYLTGITLLILLLFRLPGIWQRSGFDAAGSEKGKMGSAGGPALIVCGLLTLTTPAWAYPTHLINGSNTANVLFWPLLVGGAVLVLMGGGMAALRSHYKKTIRHPHEEMEVPGKVLCR